ncbi:sulfite oxidase heme-binding subunit YedZ [Marinobacterium litorale]|jgi:sulfoxide reductase heme-binding subunit YedZ|uniref:sulfite oxidase heme-binding subunit YedZ n=1 Tax=Marinobacterium litorale TaxID=404770 RepID=UPI000429BF94|nr:protein-methionine-sulfoxide reductase heme-binding subunit MsrQ [Marinobacterium litorale]
MVLTISELHRSAGGRRAFWWLMFLAPLLPLGALVTSAVEGQLGADPAQTIVTTLGIWTLRLLFLTLAVTPCRRLLGWLWLQRYRRMLGLYTLFYATLHLLSVATFILGWRPDLIGYELSERPYIIVGFIAWVGLVPLGITSTKGWIKRLGKRWQQLHYLIYPISLLALLHFAWLIRAGYGEVLAYGIILSLLLGYRIAYRLRR